MQKLLTICFLLLILISGHVQAKECLKNSECNSAQICKVFSCVEKIILSRDEFKLLSNQMNYLKTDEKVIMISNK